MYDVWVVVLFVLNNTLLQGSLYYYIDELTFLIALHQPFVDLQ